MTAQESASGGRVGPHPAEPHLRGGLQDRLNWLRAGVLGANDGIVSVAGLVIGVAGATTDRTAILIAGIAGLCAGALSMAVAEYVSVSSSRDSARALLRKEERELRDEPEAELAELAGLYVERGLSEPLARQVAEELTAHDALAAHAEVELGLDPDDLTSPMHAAGASLLSFSLGALLPLLTITLLGPATRVPATFAAVATALVLTGLLSAWVGQAPRARAVARIVTGGVLAMTITYLIGTALGTQIG